MELNGKRIYIAGPMTGLKDFNRDAFFDAAEYLADVTGAAVVFNPGIEPNGLKHDEYMSIGLQKLAMSEVVAFLPGWQESQGAMREFSEAVKKGLILVKLEQRRDKVGVWTDGHGPLLIGDN